MIFSAILHALTAALLAMHPAPTPAPHGVTVSPVVPAPAAVTGSRPARPEAGAPTGSGRRGVAPAPPAAIVSTVPGPDSPVCEAGQSPAADGCAQGQLPEEVIGRQEDGPGGTVCTVTDAAGDMSCAPGAPARP